MRYHVWEGRWKRVDDVAVAVVVAEDGFKK